MGSATSIKPNPLQTRHEDIGESNLNESFPVPLQNAHLIIFAMIFPI
jgi:hypothetical protein